MLEKKATFQLSGWQVVIFVIVFIGFLSFRINSMNDQLGNDLLRAKIERELIYEYYPDHIKEAQEALEAGDNEEVTKQVNSMTTAKVELDLLKISYSIFDFSTSDRDVVIKVKYRIEDASGTHEQDTKYYRYTYKPVVKNWTRYGVSSEFIYYLNFI